MYPFNIGIGKFIITSYNLFHFLGLLLLVILTVLFLDKNSPIKRWLFFIDSLVTILAGTTGAKLTHLILYAEEYRGMSPAEVLSASGHAFIGGFALALLTIFILSRYQKVSFFYLADYAMPYIWLFYALGRIGCLLAGCCKGIASNLPWALYFRDGMLRHPAQAYLFIISFSIFIASILNYKKLKDNPGIIFFSAIVMYSFGRFMVEFLRIDSPYIFKFFKLSHLILAIIFLYGVISLSILYRRCHLRDILGYGLKRLFAIFFISLIIVGAITLMILSSIPKSNYKEPIHFNITLSGINKIEATAAKMADYTEIKRIQAALDEYRKDNASYPTQEQGLMALVENPKTKPYALSWKGPYIDKKFLLYNGRSYTYLLQRNGDAWAYRLTIPSRKDALIISSKKRPTYLLDIDIHNALARYKFDNGIYPTQQQGLFALIAKPVSEPIPQNWRGPYLNPPLKNRQGKVFKYKIEKRGSEEFYSLSTD